MAAAVAILGCAAVAGVFTDELSSASDRHRRETQRAVDAHARRIEHRVVTLNSAIESITKFFESSVRVTPREWETFTRGMSTDGKLDLVQVCAYADRIDPSHIEAYERGRAGEFGQPFTVFRRPGHATAADFVAPIRYVAPMSGMEHAIGLDLASSREVSAVMNAAAKNGSTKRTARLGLELSETPTQQIVLFRPVYRDGARAGAAGRLDATQGWVVLSTRLDESLDVVGDALSGASSLEVFCEHGEEEPAFVAGWYGERSDSDSASPASARYEAAFGIGDERWSIRASVPDEQFVALAADAAPMTAVAAGFVLLTCVLVWVITSTRDRATAIATKMTDRLQRTEELLEAAGMLASLGGWEYDVRTDQLYWSRVTKRLHEVDDDYEPDIKTATAFYDGPAQSVIQFAFEQCLSSGRPFDLQLPFVTAKGNKRWVRAFGKCHTENGEPIRLHGAFQDVTRHVEVEEELIASKKNAEDASFAKSQFLANMSHEIRTPMTAILGYADLLSDRNSDESQRDTWLATIRQNGEHLLVIINDILDLSKIEAGRLDLESEPVSIAAITDEVRTLFRERAAEKNLRFEIEYATPIPQSVLGDAVRLRQVLFNLTSNAIKFTETGSVSLRVEFSEPTGTLMIEVRDTGIGMSQIEKDRVFESFSQADISTTRRFGGTGLGLRISRSLLEMMGGDLEVDSKPGEGSTFRATIEIAPDPANTALFTPICDTVSGAQKAVSTTNNMVAYTALLDGMLILVAEDGPDNQRLISYFLQEAGAEVHVVDNGQSAIESIEDSQREGNQYDLVLMDMQMPILDGYLATSRLRQAGVELPIIALTAHAMESDRQKCLQAGCDEYLTKPIKRKRLIQLCAEWAADPETMRRAA